MPSIFYISIFYITDLLSEAPGQGVRSSMMMSTAGGGTNFGGTTFGGGTTAGGGTTFGGNTTVG